MRCAEKIWALIRHAGSAPEASIGSKPIGSELVHENASLAAKCQEILDGSVARPLRTSRELTRANPHQPIDIKTDFKGNPLKWAKMGRLEACP